MRNVCFGIGGRIVRRAMVLIPWSMGGWIGIGDCIAIDIGIDARGDTCVVIEGCVGGHAMTLAFSSALAMGAKVAVGRCIGAVACKLCWYRFHCASAFACLHWHGWLDVGGCIFIGIGARRDGCAGIGGCIWMCID